MVDKTGMLRFCNVYIYFIFNKLMLYDIDVIYN
jgi:hypothetical protein